MGTYYEQWLQGPAAQQLRDNYSQGDATGFTTNVSHDDAIPNTSLYANQPDNPYTTGLSWNNSNLGFEGASEMGLFGSTNSTFGDSLRNTYKQYGKTDTDIVHAAQSALQSHVGSMGQGYTPASNWGAINNDIAKNLGVDLGGFDFGSLAGFSSQNAEDRGNIDRNKHYTGTFGNDNFFSNVLNYEGERIGDMGGAYKQSPERLLFGINNPAESQLWSGITGKQYDPTIDMYGGATNKQQADMARKGTSMDEGMLVQKGIEAAAGGIAGGAGYGNYAQAAQTGNKMQDGTTKDAFMQSVPQLTNWLASYLGGGNLSGSQGDQSLTGSTNNDTLGGSNKSMFENDNSVGGSDSLFGPSMMPQGDMSSGVQPGDIFGPNTMFGPSMGGAPSGGEGGGLLDFFTNQGGSQGGGGAPMSDQGGGTGMPNGFGGAMGKALLNFAMQSYLSNQAKGSAQQAAQVSNPMNDPRRAPFQQQATQLAQNPQDYFDNNPFAKAATSATQNLIQSATGKSGNPFQVLGSALPQWMQALGGNYDDLMKIMMTGGGMDQGAGYAGSNFTNLTNKSLDFQKNAMTGVGTIADSIFGSPSAPKQPQVNPTTGSYQMPN